VSPALDLGGPITLEILSKIFADFQFFKAEGLTDLWELFTIPPFESVIYKCGTIMAIQFVASHKISSQCVVYSQSERFSEEVEFFEEMYEKPFKCAVG